MISLESEQDLIEKARLNFRERRLALNMTQAGLAKRSGVKLATLRKFERTGKLSLESFFKLALVLDYLSRLSAALDPISKTIRTINDVLQPKKKTRQRGREE